VVERIAGVRGDDALVGFGRGAPTLVAGSTWPEDEAVLLRAFARVRARHPAARLILVPHEPTASHLLAAERIARHAGLPEPVRLARADGVVPLLLVDRVGVLASLYGAGTMAFVGGGFGRAGLHSVLEPAAWALPVAFGPRWRESRDAGLMVDARAARALDRRGDAAVEQLTGIWIGWIEREEERSAAGEQARRIVEQGRGASARCAALLAELISSPRPRTSPSVAR
jgi:3-deoxy-D-manno-octulosonic-acid transferase